MRANLFNELQTAWHDLWKAFHKVADIALKNGLVRPDKLVGLTPRRRPLIEAQIDRLINEGEYEEIDSIIKKIPGGIGGELVRLQTKCLLKAHLKETNEIKNADFDVIDELMRIFLKYVPEVRNNLIASHIFEFIKVRQNSSLRGIYLPDSPDALRQRVKMQRCPAATTEVQ